MDSSHLDTKNFVVFFQNLWSSYHRLYQNHKYYELRFDSEEYVKSLGDWEFKQDMASLVAGG
jgi:hypothetical protein